MELAKDVFLSDHRAPYLALTLASRDLAAHSLLSDLSSDEREQVHAVLANAAATIADLLRAACARREPSPCTASFGCGT
jgi:hypothetical protein